MISKSTKNRNAIVRELERHPLGRTAKQLHLATGISDQGVRNILLAVAQPVADSYPTMWRLSVSKVAGTGEKIGATANFEVRVDLIEIASLSASWVAVMKRLQRFWTTTLDAETDSTKLAQEAIENGQRLLSLGYALQQIADKPDWLALAEGEES